MTRETKQERAMRERYEKWAEDTTRLRKYRNPPSPPKNPTMQGGVYVLVFVSAGGRVYRSSTSRSPKTEWLLERGMQRKAQFAARYWPSKKGWRVIDMRKAQAFAQNTSQNSYAKWVGHRFLDTLFPDEAAATMAMIALSAA